MNNHEQFMELGKTMLENDPITAGDFFANLHNGEMPYEEFRYTQEQFYFAVNYFSQPIAALFARLGDPALRMKLLLNLMDEHGNINLDRCHTHTFKSFLSKIEAADEIKEGPEVHAFNASLIGTCAHEKEEFAIAALAMIELAFSEVSANIAEGVVARGWLQADELAHYSLHAHLDLEHAATLFDIACSIERGTDEHIIAGMRFGLFIFKRLFQDLYMAAQVDGLCCGDVCAPERSFNKMKLIAS